jgi:hypothetical protein
MRKRERGERKREKGKRQRKRVIKRVREGGRGREEVRE